MCLYAVKMRGCCRVKGICQLGDPSYTYEECSVMLGQREGRRSGTLEGGGDIFFFFFFFFYKSPEPIALRAI